jgi:hypothetical protein
MMNNLRLRFTTLHLAQRLRIDGETFIIALLLNQHIWPYSQRVDYTFFYYIRPDFNYSDRIKGLSG